MSPLTQQFAVTALARPIAGILEECDPLGLRRIALSTNDAHGLYFNLGFTALNTPKTWMERIVDPGV
ncbi:MULTISPECIES: hypothetical protein [unclassified Cryobacterium]|uniref:hypothetical protein n=1 Tax=unclassified Cryobacterium TaxID=2649013 RepID=UPI001E3C7CD1|nr:MULTISPECIES: hypothetical protein [unclassified Cryobacterium]